jgi:hypothetical protein
VVVVVVPGIVAAGVVDVVVGVGFVVVTVDVGVVVLAVVVVVVVVEAPASPNTALVTVSAFIVSVQVGPCPLQAPVQAVNTAPASGAADSDSAVP